MVVDSLKGKVEVRKKFGAGKMVQQVLSKGLRLSFVDKAPIAYGEKNNRSFENNKDFGIGEIRKLIANGAIEEVNRDEVVCINPMSIASNRPSDSIV